MGTGEPPHRGWNQMPASGPPNRADHSGGVSPWKCVAGYRSDRGRDGEGQDRRRLEGRGTRAPQGVSERPSRDRWGTCQRRSAALMTRCSARHVSEGGGGGRRSKALTPDRGIRRLARRHTRVVMTEREKVALPRRQPPGLHFVTPAGSRMTATELRRQASTSMPHLWCPYQAAPPIRPGRRSSTSHSSSRQTPPTP